MKLEVLNFFQMIQAKEIEFQNLKLETISHLIKYELFLQLKTA